MSLPLIEETTLILILALEIATFNLLSPPSRLSGPKFWINLLFLSYPYPILNIIVSLSSPWTVSRFLTKKESSLSLIIEALSKHFSINLCWEIENATTPKLLLFPYLL